LKVRSFLALAGLGQRLPDLIFELRGSVSSTIACSFPGQTLDWAAI
jgi:hypothetical protein